MRCGIIREEQQKLKVASHLGFWRWWKPGFCSVSSFAEDFLFPTLGNCKVTESQYFPAPPWLSSPDFQQFPPFEATNG